MLVERFARMTLNDVDKRHVESRRGRGDMLYILASKVIDQALHNKLNGNLDLFPVANGVFDMTNNAAATFRKIRPEDYVSSTAEWEYDPELAREHRPEVDQFLQRLCHARLSDRLHACFWCFMAAL